MLFWDYNMQPLRESFANIPTAQRLDLAMKVMDWTIQAIGPIEVEAVRSYINAGMEAGHAAVRSGQEKITLPEETLDAYTEIDDQAYEPGTSHVLSALLACADAPGGLTGEVLYDVLSYCYEGVLEKEDLPLVSLEEERRNARCIEAIDFQQRCIAQAQSA
ncbi:hypothetical protein [Streptomyces tendae]|uniref:hypothetical protein n=1 Tax=Streptomyces tendae TaxID=1932 RepID=UPI0033EC9501